MRKLLTALATIGMTAALAAGCSDGGGRNFTSSIQTTGPGTISSSLPIVTRDMGGYFFGTTVVNPVSGGAVNAISVANTASGDLFAASEPVHEIDRVSNGSSTTLGTLPFRVTTMAAIASTSGMLDVYAAQADTLTGANGDVYRLTPGGPLLAFDSSQSEAYVAAAGGTVLALLGGEGQPGQMVDMNAIGAVGSLASTSITNAIPQRAVDFNGLVYIGGTDNVVGGGQARMFRTALDGNVQEVTLPFAQSAPGMRQEFVGMVTIQGTTAGTLQATPIQLLCVAVAYFDRMTRAPAGGTVALHDGTGWETLATLFGETPTSLAFIDNTIYMGTTSGRLLYRMNDGTWLDEPNLPLSQGVYSLFVRDAKTLAIGVQTQTGAQLLVRTSLGMLPPPPPPPPAANPLFVPDVAAVLAARCTGCHVNVPTYTLTAQANTLADYNLTVARVTTATPAQSPLLLKATNAQPHGGGASLTVGSQDYNTILTWIQNGVPFTTPNPAPPPPALPVPFFIPDVSTILANNCTGCHTAVPTYTLTAAANTMADYTLTIGKINLQTPAQSGLILKATGQVQHDGGTVLQPNSPEANTLLQWIMAGAPFQAPPVTPKYLPDVASVLANRCTGCHVAVPTYMLTAQANTMMDFNLTVARVTPLNPAQSPLLLKATNQITHGGGLALPVGSDDYNTVLNWIAGGAPLQ